MSEKTIIRKAKNKENPYALIAKSIIDDERLDMRTLGLLVYILSKPDDWQTYPSFLANRFKTTRKMIYKILNILVIYGYVQKKPTRGIDGKFDGYQYLFFEIPQSVPESQKRQTAERQTAEPPAANDPLLITDSTLSNDITLNTDKNSSSPSTTTFKKIYLTEKQKNFVSKFVEVMNKSGLPYSPEFKDLKSIKYIKDELLSRMETYLPAWPEFLSVTTDKWIKTSDGSLTVFKRSFSAFKNYVRDNFRTLEEIGNARVEEPVSSDGS